MMSKLLTTIALLLLIIAVPPDTAAKSWRKITPLRSTAKDVVKLWPECKETETRCQFEVEDTEVMIIFSGVKIGDLECPQVPKGTVLVVNLQLRRPEKLEKFQLKDKQFKVFDPSSPSNRGYQAYYYHEDGFLISAYKDQVVQLVYIAAQKDIHLCPIYYDDPKAFVSVGVFP